VFFQVDGKNFDLHNVILATRMEDYILARRRAGDRIRGAGCTPEDRILINNLPGGVKTFEQIVKFCYGDENLQLNKSNAANLYYAASYFGADDISSKVESFLEQKFFENTTVHDDVILQLYHVAKQIESDHDLPDDLSRRCLSKIAQKIGDCSAHTKLLVSLCKSFDQNLIATLLEELGGNNFSEKQTSAFFAKFLIMKKDSDDYHRPSKKSKKSDDFVLVSDKQSAIQMMVQNVNPSLLPDSIALSLLSMKKDLFCNYEKGLYGFAKKYLDSKETQNYQNLTVEDAIHFSEKLMALFNDQACLENVKNLRESLDVATAVNKMLMCAVKAEQESKNKAISQCNQLIERKNDKITLQSLENARKISQITQLEGELSSIKCKAQFPFQFKLTESFLELQRRPINMNGMKIRILYQKDEWRKGTVTHSNLSANKYDVWMEAGYKETLEVGDIFDFNAISL